MRDTLYNLETLAQELETLRNAPRKSIKDGSRYISGTLVYREFHSETRDKKDPSKIITPAWTETKIYQGLLEFCNVFGGWVGVYNSTERGGNEYSCVPAAGPWRAVDGELRIASADGNRSYQLQVAQEKRKETVPVEYERRAAA